jgi:hypothetical protein
MTKVGVQMTNSQVMGQYEQSQSVSNDPIDPRQAVALTTEISSLLVRLAFGLQLNALSVTLTWDDNGKPLVSFHFDGDVASSTPLGNLDEALHNEVAI